MSDKPGIEKLIRPDLQAFGGYSARHAPETLAGKVLVAVENIIKLDANENLYGCSPQVNRALAKYTDFNIYPDDGQMQLRQLLSDYTGVAAGHIVAGSGSNQLIDTLLRLFLSPGDEVITCVPTFSLFPFVVTLCGGKLVEVCRDARFNVSVADVKQAISKKTKMIILVNPNNPTGNLMPEKDILEVLDTGLPVLVDEAYYEFSGETVAPLVKSMPNLMVLRTFSKWAGLAGMRVGYGLFPESIADYLLKIKIPYNVNVAAIVAVRESIKDKNYLLGTVKLIIDERKRLFDGLKQFKWLKPYPSRSNFILCRVLKGDAVDVCNKLERRGILVRYFETPLLKDSLRISVGKPEHTDALINALQEIEEEQHA